MTICTCIISSDIETACNTGASALKDGKIVAYPTESSYAIGTRFDDLKGIERIYQIKKRPPEKIFPLIIGDKEALNIIVSDINLIERELIERFWPGPLTLLLKAKTSVSSYIKGNNNKIAVRMSGNIIAQGLAKRAELPIISTSANPSGLPPALSVSEIRRYFKFRAGRAFRTGSACDNIDMIIDGGECKGGLSSTIIEVIDGVIKIVRHGAVNPAEIEMCGYTVI